MAKRSEITCIGFLQHKDGTLESIEEMSQERRAEVGEILGQRLADAFSEYYSLHPDESPK